MKKIVSSAVVFSVLGLFLSGTAAFASDTVTSTFTVIPISFTTDSTSTIPDISPISKGESCENYVNTFSKMGAKNIPTDVRYVQEFLNKYQNSGLPITGYFGALTKAAVIKYQISKGITPTGNVLLITRWSINNDQCPFLNFQKPVTH